MNKLLLLGLILFLSACTAIPVKTMYTLATTDPMTVDPKIIRTAARMPDWLEPRTNGASLEIKAEFAGRENQEIFILQPIPLSLESSNLQVEAKPGYKLYVYRLNPADLPRLEAFREMVKAKKAAGIKTKGSMSAGVKGCRKGELKDGAILVSNYLRLNAEQGYLPVLVDYDLRKQLDGKNLAESLPPC